MVAGSIRVFPWFFMAGAPSAKAPEPQVWSIGSSEPLPAAGTFIALAPGADAVVHSVSLPPTLKGKVREEVAIRQVQDRLNAKAGALRILPMRSAGSRDTWSSVLVAKTEDITEWRRCMGAAEARCQAILPDYLVLPTAPGLWTVVTSLEAGRTIVKVRLGEMDGFTAEAELAAFALMRARATRPLPQAVLRIGPAESEVEAALDGLPRALSSDAPLGGRPSVEVLTQGESSLDLGADPQRHATDLARWLRRLVVPVLLSAFGLMAWLAAVELETRRHLAQADALNEELNTAVRQDFLPSGPIVDIRAQVTRRISELRRQVAGSSSTSGLLLSFRQISRTLAQLDLEVVSVLLRENDGISIDVSVPDLVALDEVMAELGATAPGSRLLRSATDPGGRVIGSFFVPLDDDDA